MSARAALERIRQAALAAADPREAVARALRGEADLAAPRRVFLVGAGKAAPAMAQGALAVLGERVHAGSLTTRAGQWMALPGLDVWEAAHPLPDAHSLAAAAEALRLVRGAGEDDLVLCLLSGGASSLWSAPPPGVPLGALRSITAELMRAGARIDELNTVRRHLSVLAGGRLARAARPARVLTLALSDVVGSTPHDIGSGPTVPDPTTPADALAVLRRYAVGAPPAVARQLSAPPPRHDLAPGHPLWERTAFRVVADNRLALRAAASEAERGGFAATIVSDRMQGEAREVGREAADALLALPPAEAPAVLLWGGETTVTVRGGGRGGRSQELALSAALALDGRSGVALAAFGTDGIDGPTDAAGAVVDGGTAARARAAGVDPEQALRHNDAYTALRAAGDLLVTGPTGTNVNDLVVALAEP